MDGTSRVRSRSRRLIPALASGTLCIHNPWGYTVLPDVPLVLLVVLFSFLIGASVRSGRLAVDRTAGLLLVATAAGLVSAMFSAAPLLGLLGGFGRSTGVVTIATWCLAYMAGLSAGSRRTDRDQQLRLLVLSAVAFAVLVLTGRWGLPLTPESAGDRAVGPLGSSAFSGAALVVLLPWGLVEAFDARPGRRASGVVASTLCVLALAATGSRAAWLGATVAIAVTAVVAWRRPGRGFAFGLMLGLVVVAGVATQAFDTSDRIEAIGVENGTAAGRVALWGTGFRASDQYLILGVGMDQQESALSLELPEDFEARFGDRVIVDRSHNWLLDMWLGGGSTVVVSLVIAAALALRRCPRDPMGVAIGAGFVGYAVQAQFNFSFPPVEAVLWLLLGLAVAPSVRERALPVRAVAPVAVIGMAIGVPFLLNVVADVRLENGRRAEVAGDIDRAEREFENAASSASWQPVLSEVVVRFGLRHSDAQLAIIASEEAIRRSGGQARWRELKGEVLLSMGRFGEAADLFRELLLLRANDSSLHVGLGEALVGMGDLERARRAFESALAINPNSVRADDGLRTIAILPPRES